VYEGVSVARVGYERVLILEALKKVETFRGCEEPTLELVCDAFSARLDLQAGEELCKEGASTGSWWVVLDGTADVTLAGKRVGSIAKFETVGELAAFADEPVHGATVTAKEPLDVLEFDAGPFVRIVCSSSELARTLLREAAARLKATNALV
jgi:CRP-like cAMP-binding protein